MPYCDKIRSNGYPVLTLLNPHWQRLLTMDISETDILSRGNKFSLQEGNHTHDFEWLEFERLEKEYFYPLFLKKEIFHLPEKFTIRTECE